MERIAAELAALLGATPGDAEGHATNRAGEAEELLLDQLVGEALLSQVRLDRVMQLRQALLHGPDRDAVLRFPQQPAAATPWDDYPGSSEYPC